MVANVSTLAQNLLIRQQVQQLQTQMFDAQWQLSSGKKAKTFGGIAGDSALLLQLRNRVSRIGQFEATIGTTLARTAVMQTAMSHIAERGASVAQMAANSTSINPQMLRQVPAAAKAALGEAVSRLNVQMGDRFLFAGERRTHQPVAEADAILADFGRLIADRQFADVGPGGQGWVEAGIVGTDFVISKTLGAGLNEYTETDHDAFGFTIESVAFSAAAFAAPTPFFRDPTDPSDPLLATQHSFILDMSTPPVVAAGDVFTMELRLPDGQARTIRLAFTDDYAKAAADPEALYLTATPMADLMAAVNGALADLARKDMPAVSLEIASEMMFDYVADPAGRLGPRDVEFLPPNGYPAISFVSNITRWYDGQTATDVGSRDSAVAQVDERAVVKYGVRADEQPLRETVKMLALLALGTGVLPEEDDYKALVDRSALRLARASDRVVDIQAEIGHAEQQMQTLLDKHARSRDVFSKRVLDVEGADLYQVSTQLLQLQSQLQSSYEVTSRIYSLSLVNYLR